LSAKTFYKNSKVMKKVLVLIVLTIVAPAVQITTWIMPLLPAAAQDPIIGPPPTADPALSTSGGIANTGFPASSNITSANSSSIPPPPVDVTGGDITNATLPDGSLPGTDITNDTLPGGTFGNDTFANGTLADGALPGGVDNGAFPNASITSPGDLGAADQFGGGGGAGEIGAGGVGAEDQFGAGLLNETEAAAPPTAPPPVTTILSNNTGDSTNPNVAVSGSDVFVAWEDTTGGNREILLISSLGGQNFTTVRNVTQTAGDSLNPRLAVSGSNVYLLWEDTSNTGNGQIMFAKSSDRGATFTSARSLSNATGDSTNPNVAVSGGNVYALWEQVNTNTTSDATNSEVMFAKSSDAGTNFTSARTLSNNPGVSTNPNVAVSGGDVYIAWEDDSAGSSEIILVRSTNNGVNFAPSRNISNSPGESSDPRIAISENNVYVVWEDYSLGNSTESEIMLIRSSNSGANFASAEDLSDTPGQSTDPRIAVSEGNVYVVWEDATPEGNSEIEFVRSADRGVTFSTAKNLSNNDGISFDPRVAVSGNNVYVVWEDTSGSSATAESGAAEAGGSSDIFLARSTNNGATFGRVQNLSNSPTESFDPYIAVSRSKLFVLWSDDNQGNAEVIFTDKTRNIATPEAAPSAPGGEGFDEFGTGVDLGAAPIDQGLTGEFGAAPIDQGLTGEFGAAPIDQGLTGEFGPPGPPPGPPPPLPPVDQGLSGGAGGLGTSATDPSLQMGGGIPPS
jgi:hypothetical protein